MFVAIYRAHGYTLIKWVDDFFVICLPGQTWTEENFIGLTAPLGVPWAPTKTRPLAVQQRYIGFDWDLDKRTVSLPQEKLDAISALVATWLEPLAKFSPRRQLHFMASSFMPALFSVSFAFPPLCGLLHATFPISTRKAFPPARITRRPQMNAGFTSFNSQLLKTSIIRAQRYRLVGRCEHVLWGGSGDRQILGSLALGRWNVCGPRQVFQHWMGRSYSSRIGAPLGTTLPGCITRSASVGAL